MTCVAGAGVWKGRWAVVGLEDGRFRSAFVRPTASDVLDALEGVEALALDIPIGMPKGNDHRACGAAA